MTFYNNCRSSLLLRLLLIFFAGIPAMYGFVTPWVHISFLPYNRFSTWTSSASHSKSSLAMAQVSEAEANAGINKVVKALKKDGSANQELGQLVKVTTVLGYGSPSAGTLAVRFNAQFKKSGMGRSAIPMPFGLGQTDVSEGRGTMVGQVKASIDTKSGKITSCSVFRDLGYGRAFNLRL
jgi:hypothetical protein